MPQVFLGRPSAVAQGFAQPGNRLEQAWVPQSRAVECEAADWRLGLAERDRAERVQAAFQSDFSSVATGCVVR